MLRPRRRLVDLARFVLAWFALGIAVAVASPLLRPQAIELVCSGSGAMKLLVKTDDGSTPVAHTLECPLCAPLDAPPPPVGAMVAAATAVVAPRSDSIRVVHVRRAAAAPLPARGPPDFDVT